jgi:hypothetical protein
MALMETYYCLRNKLRDICAIVSTDGVSKNSPPSIFHNLCSRGYISDIHTRLPIVQITKTDVIITYVKYSTKINIDDIYETSNNYNSYIENISIIVDEEKSLLHSYTNPKNIDILDFIKKSIDKKDLIQYNCTIVLSDNTFCYRRIKHNPSTDD